GLAAAARGRALHDETALRAGGDDDGVLHHLGLHEAQHFRAEVLAPVRPADAAARHLAGAQMDGLDARAVDEYLEQRTRQRQLVDGARIELEGEVGLELTGAGALEEVRSQRRLDDVEEAAEDAVLVEVGDAVESALDVRHDRLHAAL